MTTLALFLMLSIGVAPAGVKAAGVPHKAPVAGPEAHTDPRTVSAGEPLLPPWAAGTLAVVPGLPVSGTGLALRGDFAGARRLLFLELAGLGFFLAGGLPVVLTNSSRYLIGPSLALVVTGAGLYLLSKYLDLMGVFAPGGLAGRAPSPSFVTGAVGVRYVHDPLFDYAWFSTLALGVAYGRLFGEEQLDWALDHRNWRSRTLAGVRFPSPILSEHVQLRLLGGFTFHSYSPERFSVMTFEGQAGLRMSGGWLLPSARGTYFDLSLGYGVEYVKWPGDASRFAEPHGLLLARFALGVYLGKGRGEIELYYNHRHDTFAGGIQFQVSGDGPAGFAGVRARYGLTPWLGLFGDVAMGNNFTALMGITLSGPKVQP